MNRSKGASVKLALIEMHTIVKRVRFCYGHRLLDYEGRCAHPHGHNAVLEIELSQEHLDRCGMVCDFGEVEKSVIEFLDLELDHRMLLREDDLLVKALRDVGESPFVMKENPTAENIAKLIFGRVKDKNFPVVAVRLWETEDSVAEYRIMA